MKEKTVKSHIQALFVSYTSVLLTLANLCCLLSPHHFLTHSNYFQGSKMMRKPRLSQTCSEYPRRRICWWWHVDLLETCWAGPIQNYDFHKLESSHTSSPYKQERLRRFGGECVPEYLCFSESTVYFESFVCLSTKGTVSRLGMGLSV